jgi:outer membrane protein OmpA-like peptidoglycan-associated protein
VIGGHTDRLVWSLAAGPELRASQKIEGFDQGSMMRMSAGAALLLLGDRRLQIGPEASVALNLKQVNNQTTNAEVMLSARYRIAGGVEIGAGGGPGLTSGIGTPGVRFIGMLAYSPEQLQRPSDRDGDGIADKEDACPDERGPRSADPERNGCPAAAPPTEVAAADECDGDNPPPDKCPADDDGLEDSIIRVPGTPGLNQALVMTIAIRFDTAKASIDPSSGTTVDALARLLSADPYTFEIEVQGHTDSRGTTYTNAILGQERAEAVMQALVERGVDRNRLRTKAFGPYVPRSPNATPEGRRKNRRVELRIIGTAPSN